MRFDKQLFREAFKAGYKKALLNERKMDSFAKTYREKPIDDRLYSGDLAQKFFNGNSAGVEDICQRLKELNDDRPLEWYLKPVSRFYALITYLGGIYKHNQRPKNSEIKEVYKTYRDANTNLENLFAIIDNTNYDDEKAKHGALKSISYEIENVEDWFDNSFAKYHGDLGIGDLDPNYFNNRSKSINWRLAKKQLKRLNNTARNDIDMR